MIVNWKLAAIVCEGEPVCIDGLDLWKHRWISSGESVEVSHPQYPTQRHRLSIYEIHIDLLTIVFAAGEFSANVWGFYVPDTNRTAGTLP
jgi:hypothetical protein